MIIPWWRSELFKRMTFQSKTLTSVVGTLVFTIGWYFMIYTAYKDLPVLMTNIVVGLVGIIVFTVMIARGRSRGIEVEKVYYEIPPA
jgi:glycopeptide antibiotics resistance protein